MPEQEPPYFKKFREYVEAKFDGVDRRFELLEHAVIDTYKITQKIGDKIDVEIDGLASISAKHFERLDRRIDKVEGNLGQVKDSINRLEKAVFA